MYDALAIKQVRNMYVFKCFDLRHIAKTLDIPYRTASRWKSDAKKTGDCWRVARTNALISTGDTGTVDILLNEFVTFFNATMDEVITTPDITALQKVTAISALGDAYTKVIKSASKTDPAKTQLAIALDAIKKLIDYLEVQDKQDAIELLIPELTGFGEYYKKTVGRK